jgi:Flp pilus assembly protein TadG
MRFSLVRRAGAARRRGGQVLAIFALALFVIVGMVALVLEGGNAFAQQRITQNAADAAANAGAVVLAERLGGATRTDAHVDTAVTAVAGANDLAAPVAYYTDVRGQLLRSDGSITTDPADAAVVGSGVNLNAEPFRTNVAGVRAGGTRPVPTFFARVIGITQFDASADATAVTGKLVGGPFLPVIFPINIVDCEENGDTGVGEENWYTSTLPAGGGPPTGPEYIVPLCKTGTAGFQILDLDPDLKCKDEIENPPSVIWDSFPVEVDSDQGNDCAKPIAEYVNANYQDTVVYIPICQVDCVTTGGGKAVYNVRKVAAFYLDYMVDSNNKNESACKGNGTTLITIAGNGSSSCIAGWFIRYITGGPVGLGTIGNTDAIGVQLIR